MTVTLPSHWTLPTVDEALCQAIAAQFQLLPQTARLLVRRGLRETAEIETFLNPTLQHLIHPEKMFGMQEAVARILVAFKQKQKIMIHGDYDVDGVTSAALLYRFFKQLGQTPLVYIPDRLTENHGVNQSAVDLAHKSNVKLFITCDCGISSAKEIAALKERNIDTIVTDHHLVPEEGPPREAIIVNPSQEACGFGDEGMSGVGIAFYLAMALRKALREEGYFSDSLKEPVLRDYLDLVTLGTIADQAPLRGQNRIFVKNGLPLVAATDKTGLRVLLNLCLPADRTLSVEDIAFYVAPKLNAAGRLGKANEAFELLIEDDPVRSAVLARKLMNYNDERRRIEEQHLREAIYDADQWAASLKLKELPGLVLYRPEWHLGVVGIIAQKLTERFRCPTIVLTRVGEKLKGSGRSYAGISLIDAIRAASSVLQNFGGHSMAAGVTLAEEQFAAFRERFCEVLLSMGRPADADLILTDGELEVTAINDRLIEEISRLSPFGQGNPEPHFVLVDVAPKDLRRIGEHRKHLRLTLAGRSGGAIGAVGFSMGELAKHAEKTWHVLGTPEFNHWQGRRTIQLRIHEVVF